jgi:hypothetical protein
LVKGANLVHARPVLSGNTPNTWLTHCVGLLGVEVKLTKIIRDIKINYLSGVARVDLGL